MTDFTAAQPIQPLKTKTMNSNPHGIFILEPEKIPNSLETFKETIHAVHAKIQSPIGMVLASALSTAATCTQGLVDVMCPGSGRSPISLYLLVSANSGERKTSTDRQFSRCISDFELAQHKHSYKSTASQAAAQDTWEAQRNALKQALGKAIAKNDEESVFKLKEELIKLYETKPTSQAAFRMLFEDTTMPALLRELATTCKSAYLNSSEGGILLGRASGEYLLYLNKIWDGDEARIDRTRAPSYVLRDSRLSLSAMTQEKILQRFLKRKDNFARHSGFLSRCLAIAPTSTQGSRTHSLSEHQISKNQKYIDWFHAQAIYFLNKTSAQEGSTRRVISFSPGAAKKWQHFYQQVESELTEHGSLADIRDFASKISNNMSRLAAVLHCFCGLQGDISAETAEFSASLCRIFTNEFKKIFGLKNPIMEAYENSQRLYNFLLNLPHQGNSKRWLCQYGPCRLSVDFDAAVNILCKNGFVHIEPGMKGSYFVYLNSYALNSISAPLPLPPLPAEDSWEMLLQTVRSKSSVI